MAGSTPYSDFFFSSMLPKESVLFSEWAHFEFARALPERQKTTAVRRMYVVSRSETSMYVGPKKN